MGPIKVGALAAAAERAAAASPADMAGHRAGSARGRWVFRVAG